MTDYIKREDVDTYFNNRNAWYNFYETLESIPSADVAEVRHSVWRVVSTNPDKEYECMRCKKAVEWKYLYCPNCGAKMDGEKP